MYGKIILRKGVKEKKGKKRKRRQQNRITGTEKKEGKGREEAGVKASHRITGGIRFAPYGGLGSVRLGHGLRPFPRRCSGTVCRPCKTYGFAYPGRPTVAYSRHVMCHKIWKFMESAASVPPKKY
jgi:hypothetical protein